MVTVTIGFGLNVGDQPLPEDEVRHLRQGLHNVLSLLGSTILFVGTGTGWSEGWGTEPGLSVTASVPRDQVERLRGLCKVLARYASQEAFAFTTGATEVVAA